MLYFLKKSAKNFIRHAKFKYDTADERSFCSNKANCCSLELFQKMLQVVFSWSNAIIHEIIKKSANNFVRYAALSYWYRRRCALKLTIN